MQTYKKALLGNIKEEALKEDEPAEVEILRVELVCPDRKNGNINLEFKNHNPKEVRKFTIKEGCVYCMRVHFIVRNDIVFGLKFVNNVYKMLAKGNIQSIQSIKMKIKWAALPLRLNLTNSTFRGLKPLVVSWPEEISKAKDWYLLT